MTTSSWPDEALDALAFSVSPTVAKLRTLPEFRRFTDKQLLAWILAWIEGEPLAPRPPALRNEVKRPEPKRSRYIDLRKT